MCRLPLLLAACCCAALVLAAPAAAQSSNPWLAERIVNFAHQGGEDELPSNTMYAYREALKAGADMLEIDVGATRDGRLAVIHDNTVDRTTNGTGSITDMTLAEIQALDAAYWFAGAGRGTDHGAPAPAYVLRGVRTGARKPPRGYTADDFRVPSLEDVLRAFPRVPMNIEIKGRDGSDQAVYRRTAELLAGVLDRSRRTDVIVASFEQPAIDRFHELAPRVPVAPGIDGTAAFYLSNGSPGEGVAAFQVPITFRFGDQLLTITTPDFVKRSHEAGYAVHVWLSNDREDDATYRRLLAMCVDAIMAAKPKRLERILRRLDDDPCGTRVARRASRVRRGRAALPLARRGQSEERRSGRVRLATDAGHALGNAAWKLATEQDRTTARVELNRRARTLLHEDGRLRALAEVVERGRVVSSRPIILR